MSAPPIWGSDPVLRAARAAGWGRAELWWEFLQARAIDDWNGGRQAAALRRFRAARWLAAAALPAGDLRQATSLANAGFAARAAGAETAGRRAYARAAALWAAAPARAGALTPAAPARSSLHHLRLEMRHRGTYLANARARLAATAAHAGAWLDAGAAGTGPARPDRLQAGWSAARQRQFDDTRRFLSACLLIAAPA